MNFGQDKVAANRDRAVLIFVLIPFAYPSLVIC